MAHPGEDDVVDPLVRAARRLAGEDADRRPTGLLGPARRRLHHLAEAAADNGAAALREEPPHLLGALKPLAAAPDHRDLSRHAAMIGLATMDELERASAFEERIREVAAGRIVPFRYGTAVITESLPDVWDLNLLRVERPGASATELVEEAERIQGGAGLRHRRVIMLDRGEAEAFAALGWESGRFLFMAYRGKGERTIDTTAVREVDRALVRPLRAEMARTAPWATNVDTVQRVMVAQERVAEGANARHFAVLEGDTVVSTAELYRVGTTAQVEDVVTLEAHRGRGYASAVVLAAVERALSEGCDFVFLVADDEDWPKELYARLGFEPIGHKWAFIRKLD